MSDSPPGLHNLDYRPPSAKPGSTLRIVIIVASCLVVFLGIWRSGVFKQLYASLERRYWLDRCMIYSLPPGTMVYDTYLPMTSRLLNTPFDHISQSDPGSVLFMHQRSAGPRFSRQLVVVSRLFRPYRDVGPDRWLSAKVRGDHADLDQFDALPLPPYRDRLRIFAGQADIADDSHFTIPYDADNKPGVIDGWLRSDGSVLLSDRNSPATQPG